MDTPADELAGRVREALLRAVIEAYEDAGLRGLCAEGRWECAVGALGALDLGEVCGPRRIDPPRSPNRDATRRRPSG